MSRFPPRVFLALLAAGALFVTTGCSGGGKGDLSGVVKYQNRLVRSGNVLVLGKDGVPRSSRIGSDGSYAITGIPAGPVKFAVNSPDLSAVPIRSDKFGTHKPPPRDPNWFPLPPHYADFEKSERTATVEKGSNSHDVELD